VISKARLLERPLLVMAKAPELFASIVDGGAVVHDPVMLFMERETESFTLFITETEQVSRG